MTNALWIDGVRKLAHAKRANKVVAQSRMTGDMVASKENFIILARRSGISSVGKVPAWKIAANRVLSKSDVNILDTGDYVELKKHTLRKIAAF